jgi:hypothetical protein
VAINLDAAILNLLGIVVGSLIVSPILWLVGRAFVGKEKARFSDAFWIAFLGQVVGSLFNFIFFAIFEGFTAVIIVLIIQLLIWLALVRHFFDTSGGKALLISIVAVIVTAVIFAVLALVLMGFGMLVGWVWF